MKSVLIPYLFRIDHGREAGENGSSFRLKFIYGGLTAVMPAQAGIQFLSVLRQS